MQIICIGDRNVRAGINEVWDICDFYDGEVTELSMGVQADFNIITVEGLTVNEVRLAVELKIPQVEPVYKADSSLWSFTEPQTKEVWKDSDGKWKFMEKRPAMALTLKGLTVQDIADLGDVVKTKAEKLIILDKVQEKISFDSNNLALAKDLNV